jgi:hypothetical protein
MTAFGKMVGWVLILIAATGSPAWCWPVRHGPLPDPSNSPARLTNAPDQSGLPVFLASRSTSTETTWLVRRMPLPCTLPCQTPAPTTANGSHACALRGGDPGERDGAAESLIRLHSQLTV